MAAAPAATSAPTAVRAPYVDTRVRDCAGEGSGCRPGTVVHHWHQRGSSDRGVGWVYASREGVRSGTARWLVKKPGGTWMTGGGWKRANRVGSHVETSWGRDGAHRPEVPARHEGVHAVQGPVDEGVRDAEVTVRTGTRMQTRDLNGGTGRIPFPGDLIRAQQDWSTAYRARAVGGAPPPAPSVGGLNGQL